MENKNVSDLENRITHLESNLKGHDTMREPPGPDDIIRRLGLDPDMVRATAKENNQSMAEVVAGKLGMSYKDFQGVLKAESEKGYFTSGCNLLS
jgi:hypothetical protein